MSADEYVPNENQARAYYATTRNEEEGVLIPEAFEEWSRFLARVRRDAYGEGYERGMSDHCDAPQPCDGPTAAESNPYRQETDR